jgi:hypothetical protein
MPTREEVLKQALELSPEDQEILRIQLHYSSQSANTDPDEIIATPELAAKWTAEIDRRIDAYQRGEATAEAADVVMKRLKERVDALTQAKKAS